MASFYRVLIYYSYWNTARSWKTKSPHGEFLQSFDFLLQFADTGLSMRFQVKIFPPLHQLSDAFFFLKISLFPLYLHIFICKPLDTKRSSKYNVYILNLHVFTVICLQIPELLRFCLPKGYHFAVYWND